MDWIDKAEKLVNAFGPMTVLLALIVYFLYKKLWKKESEKKETKGEPADLNKGSFLLLKATELQKLTDDIGDIKAGVIDQKKRYRRNKKNIHTK